MRIGISCSSLLTVKTGIGYYTENLVRELITIDRENQYVLFFNSYSKALGEFEFLDAPNVKVKRYRIPGPLLIKGWQYLKFPPIECFTGKIDVMHYTDGYIAPQLSGEKIATIHDVYFARNPDKTDTLGGQYLAKTLPKTIRTIRTVVADSLFTKNEIIECLNVDKSKIEIVYPGVNKRFKIIRNSAILDAVRNEYCLPKRFILCVSTLEPRKNIEGLLLSYNRLKEILNNVPKLVIVGTKGWQYEEIFDLAGSLNLTDDVIFTDYVSEEHLPIIYNLALLFIFPSFYEGFGFPVVEAMACGLPVITSRTSSLKEIAAEAASFVDPNNYFEIAAAMKEMILSHRLRDRLSIQSLNNVKSFTWEHCAKKMLEIYQNSMQNQ